MMPSRGPLVQLVSRAHRDAVGLDPPHSPSSVAGARGPASVSSAQGSDGRLDIYVDPAECVVHEDEEFAEGVAVCVSELPASEHNGKRGVVVQKPNCTTDLVGVRVTGADRVIYVPRHGLVRVASGRRPRGLFEPSAAVNRLLSPPRTPSMEIFRRSSADTEPAGDERSVPSPDFFNRPRHAGGTPRRRRDGRSSPELMRPGGHLQHTMTFRQRRASAPPALPLATDSASCAAMSPRTESPTPVAGTFTAHAFSLRASYKGRDTRALGLHGEQGREVRSRREAADPSTPSGSVPDARVLQIHGSCSLVLDAETAQEIALWEIPVSGGKQNARQAAEQLSELRAVRHPNLLAVLGADVRKGTAVVQLFTEIPGRSLRDMAQKYDLSGGPLLRYCRHVLRAIAELNANGRVHGRLDQHSIAITKDGQAQVCLWGVTEAVLPGSPTKRDDCNSLGQVMRELDAPEVLCKKLLRVGASAEELLRDDDFLLAGSAGASSSPRQRSQGSPWHSRDWHRVCVLGRGSFGEVYRVVSARGESCAMKVMNFNDAQQATAVLEEIQTHGELDHENIVRYNGFSVDGGKLLIYMELMQGGTLAALLQNSGRLQDALAARYLRHILAAIDYLHTRPAPILHRDLKGLNVLLTEDLSRAKISDFGASKVQEAVSPGHARAATVTGTIMWMAPEVLRGIVTTAGDIWSVGCVACEMLSGGSPPWPKHWSMHESVFRIGQWQPDESELPPGAPECSKAAEDLLRACFRVNHEQRPTAAALLKEPYLVGNQPRAEDFALQTVRDGRTRPLQSQSQPCTMQLLSLEETGELGVTCAAIHQTAGMDTIRTASDFSDESCSGRLADASAAAYRQLATFQMDQ
eukprot:TRINITY_DN47206_c0_g1_i1.p1 TRINITY_DN47206_c0_g1~~TRINITY_DN47206_c0_g1_i1.p1  ORF type:complete len:863 (+),score=200.90 TRINITY_DN47206_c0_g1_i1:98-2686(+)